jgi:hypothetical protein
MGVWGEWSSTQQESRVGGWVSPTASLVEVNANLSLCLINKAPSHDDV